MIRTIGYVCDTNPYIDRKAWSGTRYKIREALENAGYTVIWIPDIIPSYLKTTAKILLMLIYGRKFQYRRHPIYLWLQAKYTDKSRIGECDILFFPGDAQLMAFMKCKIPFIYYSDATYKNFMGYYGNKPDVYSAKYGNKYERYAIQNCCIKLSSSSWCAKSAEKDYGCLSERNKVLEFGANIDEKDIKPITPYDGKGILNILFSAVDWHRKGGPKAIEAVKELNTRGIKTKLHICGIAEFPEDQLLLPSFVENHGFLNKNIPDQYRQYLDIISQCHLLLLPTRAECSAIIISEACAFRIPVFTHNTGGLGNYVIDGVNGYKLPLEATGKDFADCIQRNISPKDMRSLSDGARHMYEERLSWSAWSRRIRKILGDVEVS